MSCLDASWNLEQRLKDVACPADLKVEILNYISSKHQECTGKRYSISNLVYRGNLHYIEDNIAKEGLINELRLLTGAKE